MLLGSAKSGLLMVVNRTCRRPVALKTAVATFRIQLTRPISTENIFMRDIAVDLAAHVPAPPPALPPPKDLSEMFAKGQSILEELELWDWWKPSAWIRWGLEYTHFTLDMPWWGTIIVCTVLFRVVTIFIPLKMNKLVAKQKQYMPEITEFRKRIQEAEVEGNNLLVQQILREQWDFMRKKEIKVMAHLPLAMLNGVCYSAQFFAYRSLTKAKFPGMQEEGILWFPDLTTGDPYWLLPILSSLTLHLVLKSGVEFGNMETMTAQMRYIWLYGAPVVAFFFSSQFPAALCFYWFVNNVFSMFFSSFLRTEIARRALSLPAPPKVEGSSVRSDIGGFWKQFKSYNETLSAQKLRQEDIEQFKKAGKGRPVYMEAENLRKRRAEEEQEKAQEAVGDEAKKSATS